MLGLYDGDDLGPHWRLSTDHERMPDEFAMQLINLLNYVGVAREQISGVAIASGVPMLTSRWRECAATTCTAAARHQRTHAHRPHHPL